jgi:hypothetical protein
MRIRLVPDSRNSPWEYAGGDSSSCVSESLPFTSETKSAQMRCRSQAPRWRTADCNGVHEELLVPAGRIDQSCEPADCFMLVHGWRDYPL